MSVAEVVSVYRLVLVLRMKEGRGADLMVLIRLVRGRWEGRKIWACGRAGTWVGGRVGVGVKYRGLDVCACPCLCVRVWERQSGRERANVCVCVRVAW